MRMPAAVLVLLLSAAGLVIAASPANALAGCDNAQHGSPGTTSFTLHVDSISSVCEIRAYVKKQYVSGYAYGPWRNYAPSQSEAVFYTHGCDDYGAEVKTSTGSVYKIKLGDC